MIQGDEDLWGLTNFNDPGGWPMSDNDIFQVGLDPEETMIHVAFILLAVILLQAVTLQ